MSPKLEHEYYVADPLEFIREKMTTSEFLMFMTPEQEEEWTYVFFKIKQLWFKDDTMDRDSDFGVMYIQNSPPVWWVRKKRVDLGELARHLGIKEEAMSTSAITMLGLGAGWQACTPLPVPTVDGYGEA